MKWVFWISAALIAYTYVGYPLSLYLRSRWRPQPLHPAPILPFVSILMAVHNEAESVRQKLQNLRKTSYPTDRYEVIVVSDGSTDDTNEILATEADEGLRVITCSHHKGKASALNLGMLAARGQIVVFVDARQIIEPDALRHLVTNFADPAVGCVSGELLLSKPEVGIPMDGVGQYWTLEKKIRQWESAVGSVVGATGALYAVRRNLLVSLPSDTILDDVYIPLYVTRQGYRVVFEPRARARDPLRPTARQEFQRKIRTLTGNYQLLQLMPWALTRTNPLRFQLISHKLLRLIVPFLLGAVLVSSLLLNGSFYRFAAGLQLLFYGFGLTGFLRPESRLFARPANLIFAFLLLNIAAVMALAHFLLADKQVWVRSGHQ